MSRFETPEPIAVSVDLGVGDLQIVAGDRTDTVVDVRPTDPAKRADVQAAERTRVMFRDGRLTIDGPKASWKQFAFRNDAESVDVRIELPAGSRVEGTVAVAGLRATGRLAEVRMKAGVGDVHIDEVGLLEVKSGAGRITVEHAHGHAVITTGSGDIDVARADSTAVVKNSNGDIRVGVIDGDLRVKAANGKIVVDAAHAAVVAKTAYGDVRLGEVAHGAVDAATAFGKIDIGVRHGVAAWLDLNTSFGAVRNGLDATDRPADGDDTVEVRARTAFGDISVRRVEPASA